MNLVPVHLVLLVGSVATACGGSTSQASPSTGSDTPEPASASTAALDIADCPRNAEELARALAAVASHDVPPPTAEDMVLESEWTEELHQWNRLQSERLRVAEGASTPGVSGRHRVWVHALREAIAALEGGPFRVELEPDGSGHFRAGAPESSEPLTVRVVEERGCVRIDDR